MNQKLFIEKIISAVDKTPSEVKIYSVRQHSLSELQERSKNMLRQFSELGYLSPEKGDRVQEKERTLTRLPRGGRSVFYHASGYSKFVLGLMPFENLFEKEPEKSAQEKMIYSVADRVGIKNFARKVGTIEFEHLWRIKASATNKEKQIIKPVLCRIIGAYRHKVDAIPVLGAASVAIKLAANNKLDTIAFNLREISGEPIASAPVISVEEAAKRMWFQLNNLRRNYKEYSEEKLTVTSVRFGYLALGKREVQHVLAPHFFATINIDGKDESQGYQFVVRATEDIYQPLPSTGSHPTDYFVQRKYDKQSQN
jgi:hypothetical protein